jgi:predicted MPP superfamily phosphohydrolase
MSALISATRSPASCFDVSNCIDLLSPPSRPEGVDTQRLLRLELDLAKFIREFYETVDINVPDSVVSKLMHSTLKRIEGPWAPHDHDLPKKRSPEMSGNSPRPFFEPPLDKERSHARRSKVAELEQSLTMERLSTWTTIYEYELPLPAQHRQLDGMKVLHLSDVHLLKDNHRPTEQLEQIDSYLAQNDPRLDLILFSGDLITRSPDDLSDRAFKVLQKLSQKAQHSFFTLGNHDYHGHTPLAVGDWITRAGFHEITNKSVDLSRSGSKISLFGIDDAYFGSPQAPTPESVSTDSFNIGLTHNLDSIRSNFPRNFHYWLSGHTHGGEAWLKAFGYLMKTWNYLDDLNQNIRGWSMLTDTCASFVHPGMARYYVKHPGLWLPPGAVVHTFRA